MSRDTWCLTVPHEAYNRKRQWPWIRNWILCPGIQELQLIHHIYGTVSQYFVFPTLIYLAHVKQQWRNSIEGEQEKTQRVCCGREKWREKEAEDRGRKEKVRQQKALSCKQLEFRDRESSNMWQDCPQQALLASSCRHLGYCHLHSVSHSTGSPCDAVDREGKE